MSKLHVSIGVAVLGLLLAIGGIIILDEFPKMLKAKIKKELPLINGTDAFERWQQIAVPIKMMFYVFELNNTNSYTNLNDIQLIERGPYVFDETRTKQNISFYLVDNESLVSYRERRKYKFREDLSVGSYKDTIQFINLPLLGVIFNEILTDGKTGFDLFKDQLDDNEKSLFTNRTVGQLLFDGINLKLFKHLEPFIPKGSGIVLKPFSLFEGRKSLINEMSIHTGIDSLDKFGQIFRFDNKLQMKNNDKKKSLVWPFHEGLDPLCNLLSGTDGTFFKPNVNKVESIYVFESQVCRTMTFKYLKQSKVRGIQTLRYYLPEESYQSPLQFKPNSCYCLQKNVTECKSNGALKISHCLRVSRGAPVIVSAPYFFMGDQLLRDQINLIAPKTLNLENYGTFLDIEPMTGVVLKVTKRLQIGIKLEHSDAIPQLNATKSGKEYIIPVLWLEESAEADEKQANLLKSRIFNVKKLVTGASIASVAVGVFLIMMASYLITQNFK